MPPMRGVEEGFFSLDPRSVKVGPFFPMKYLKVQFLKGQAGLMVSRWPTNPGFIAFLHDLERNAYTIGVRNPH